MESETQSLLQEGDALFRDGEVDKAVARFQEAAAKPYESSRAAAALAGIEYFRYRFEEAAHWHREVRDPGLEEWKQAFRGLLETHRPKEWRSHRVLFECATPAAADSTGVVLLHGELLPDYEQDLLVHALKKSPKCVAVVSAVSHWLFARKGKEAALSNLLGKLNSNPGSPAVLTALGEFYLVLGENETATEYLRKAIKADSRNYRALLLLGKVAERGAGPKTCETGRSSCFRDEGFVALHTAVKLYPADPLAHLELGDYYLEIGDLGAAAARYKKSLKLTRYLPGLNQRLAQIALKAKERDVAADYMREEQRINPEAEWPREE